MAHRSDWTLFTLRGVSINVHMSLLFLLLYVVLIATGQFARIVQESGVEPGSIDGSPIVWAVVFSISLVFSIFLHEFSHVLVAQSEGATVRRVTLMMLGGMSEMDKMPEHPAAEFKVAVVGPIVSLGIAALLFTLHHFAVQPNLILYGYWVGQLNLVLGIFNLLPAFPMDGGRVLRSFLVARQGLLRGTRNAVTVSKVFVWVFGVLGILQFNILLILIAFFIYAGAKSELFTLIGRTVLKGMNVGDLLIELPVLSDDDSLRRAAVDMQEAKSPVLPVGGRNVGIMDAAFLENVPKSKWDDLRVRDLKIVVADPPTRATPLENLISSQWLSIPRGLPVVEEDEIVGVIRHRDLIDMIQLRALTNDESGLKSSTRKGESLRPFLEPQ